MNKLLMGQLCIDDEIIPVINAKIFMEVLQCKCIILVEDLRCKEVLKIELRSLANIILSIS